ncbi:MAG: efflux RND transporter periplasmic adaptor subunit [Gammaproteobacteria bacterium]|nr:efflux RND transporter periplasmic adaptor subunit [Gammaproteobacteria bacterium]
MKSVIVGLAAGFFLGSAAQAAELPARVHWEQVAELSAAVAGTVQQVHVQAGQAVSKDQELLSLDPAPFQTDLRDAGGRRKGAAAEQVMKRQDMQRAQELYDTESLSTLQLDQARLELTRAEAALEQADAAVARAQYRLERAVLRAPFDGWVLSRNVNPGRHLSPGDQAPVLIRIAAKGEFLAVADSDTPRPEWVAGTAVNIRFGERRWPGELLAPALEADPEGRFPVTARFRSDAPIPAGAQVVLELP